MNYRIVHNGSAIGINIPMHLLYIVLKPSYIYNIFSVITYNITRTSIEHFASNSQDNIMCGSEYDLITGN